LLRLPPGLNAFKISMAHLAGTYHVGGSMPFSTMLKGVSQSSNFVPYDELANYQTTMRNKRHWAMTEVALVKHIPPKQDPALHARL